MVRNNHVNDGQCWVSTYAGCMRRVAKRWTKSGLSVLDASWIADVGDLHAPAHGMADIVLANRTVRSTRHNDLVAGATWRVPIERQEAGTMSVDLDTARSVAGELGFEPRQTESESVVLPLHHSPRDSLASAVACQNHGNRGRSPRSGRLLARPPYLVQARRGGIPQYPPDRGKNRTLRPAAQRFRLTSPAGCRGCGRIRWS
jgi:hypothetical protein